MIYYVNNELYHHGIKGQKWGVRRFQNPDGTLTPRGKKRVNKYGGKLRQNLERAKLEYKDAKKYGTDEEKAQKKEALKEAKNQRKEAIQKKISTLGYKENAQPWGSYNKKRTAKYMVDRGMTKLEAIRKSKMVTAGKSIIAATLLTVGTEYLDYKIRQGRIYVHNNNVAVDAYAKARGLKEYSAGPTLGIKQYQRGKAITEAVFGK